MSDVGAAVEMPDDTVEVETSDAGVEVERSEGAVDVELSSCGVDVEASDESVEVEMSDSCDDVDVRSGAVEVEVNASSGGDAVKFPAEEIRLGVSSCCISAGISDDKGFWAQYAKSALRATTSVPIVDIKLFKAASLCAGAVAVLNDDTLTFIAVAIADLNAALTV